MAEIIVDTWLISQVLQTNLTGWHLRDVIDMLQLIVNSMPVICPPTLA